MLRAVMILQKIHTPELSQVIESLLFRNSLSLRKFTDSGHGPCNLLLHVKKYTKKDPNPASEKLIGVFASKSLFSTYIKYAGW